jgi:putative protein-disulfide isomerase
MSRPANSDEREHKGPGSVSLLPIQFNKPMIPVIYYCYDAYCGWCYGFSLVIKKIETHYRHKVKFETLSGGMIPASSAQHISRLAGYIREAYKTVEQTTGVRFGEDYLWHINNPDQSDWFPHSEKPAIAMAVFKDYHPDDTVSFAADLQYGLHFEGRDLTDDEAYRHLLQKYGIPAQEFYEKLHAEEYRERAYHEFSLVRQLQVTGFPAVLMQVDDLKFYLLARGYTDYETLTARIDKVLAEWKETEPGQPTKS